VKSPVIQKYNLIIVLQFIINMEIAKHYFIPFEEWMLQIDIEIGFVYIVGEQLHLNWFSFIILMAMIIK
jgi:hypothetical protein